MWRECVYKQYFNKIKWANVRKFETYKLSKEICSIICFISDLKMSLKWYHERTGRCLSVRQRQRACISNHRCLDILTRIYTFGITDPVGTMSQTSRAQIYHFGHRWTWHHNQVWRHSPYFSRTCSEARPSFSRVNLRSNVPNRAVISFVADERRWVSVCIVQI